MDAGVAKKAEDHLAAADNSNQDDALLCGLKPVLELLRDAPGRIDTIFVRRGARGELVHVLDMCRAAKVRFKLCGGPELNRLVGRSGEGGVQHQGVAARLFSVSLTEWSSLLLQAGKAPLPVIVAADQIQDPGNIGTLVRTLYALGGAGLLLPKHNSAFLGPGARRAAAGALERLPISRVTNLSRACDEAIDAGFHVYGAAFCEESSNIFESTLAFPAVLILGGESRGLRFQIRKRCEKLFCIPMLRPFDSLNVAQAGAVLIAECLRRRMMQVGAGNGLGCAKSR